MTTLNLNKFRKAKQKAEKQKTAETNRVKFGQTKSQKAKNKKQSESDKNTDL